MVGIEKLTVTICCQFQIYPGSVDVGQNRIWEGEVYCGRIATLGNGGLTAQIP